MLCCIAIGFFELPGLAGGFLYTKMTTQAWVVILISDMLQKPIHHFLSALFRHGELALVLHFGELIA